MDLDWKMIEEKATKYRLHAKLVGAIILQESNNRTYAMRHEAHWRYAYDIKTFAENAHSSQDTERIGQMTSWGLMQVMGTVARELGFSGYFSMLCVPSIGVEYGCKKLRTLYNKYEELGDIVASYNAGSVRKTKGGFYHNQRYVDSVFKHYKKLKDL